MSRSVTKSVFRCVHRATNVPAALSGGASINSAEAQQFFDRWLTPPTAEQETLYGALIDGLVADGVWSRLDQLCLFAAHDQSMAQTNLKSVNFNASVLGTATWTQNRGFTGSGINNCISTGFNPSTAAGSYARNDASFGVWSRTATQINKQCVILSDATSSISFWLRYPTDRSYITINGVNGVATSNAVGAVPDGSGFFIANRTSSTAIASYRNNTVMASGSDTSTALPNATIRCCADDRQIAVWFCGASLDSTQRLALQNRLSAYLTAIGAA